MNKGLIVTLPDYDIVTNYLSQFSKPVIDEALNQNISVKKIIDKDLSKEEFEKVLKKLPNKMVFLNGHGTEFGVYGRDKEFIIKENENDKLLAGRITYARACDTAVSLGKSVVEKDKNGCFVGYELPFEFYHDINWELSPLKDKTAEIFFNPSNLILLSLLKGNTVFEANKKSKNAILKNIKRALEKEDSESLAIASSLWNNYIGQVVLGNASATL